MEWGVILYPGVAQPVGDPSDWIEPVFFDGWMNPAATLMPTIDLRLIGGDIANMPFLHFVGEPKDFFEAEWLPGLGQQNQDVLMPVYDPRFLHGDIANFSYFSFQLTLNIHFGPDATGDFADPAEFEIIVKPGEFEIRSPL